VSLLSRVVKLIEVAMLKLRNEGPRGVLVGSAHHGEWHFELTHEGERVRITVERIPE
jgi:hypothetical protein